MIARQLALFVTFCSCASAQTAVKGDVILQAMKDEMARARALRLVDVPPYFIEYSLDDADLYSVNYSLGSLISERKNRFRQPRTRIRVGDPKLDNSNHVYSDAYRGSRFDSSEFPLDDNYDALRIGFWLATDRGYKQALEALARKKASLKNINQAEQLPDFGVAPAVSLILPAQKRPYDPTRWKGRLKETSALFSKYPEVLNSDVSLGISLNSSYLVNNEGTEFRVPDNLSTLRIRAGGTAADGMPIREYAEFVTNDTDRLPTEADVRKAALSTAEAVKSLLSAPVGEAYSGPVLFEGIAAGQLIAEVFGRHLSPMRRPVMDPERPINFPSGELEGRIGSRLFPDWIDVVDDASQKEWRGNTLLGFYPIDIEGVVPRSLVVVEKGTLKSFYSTRQPIVGAEVSNGHARIPSSLGNNAALPGSLFVKAGTTVSSPELTKKLLEIGKKRSKPYVMVVRKMDFPSTASLEELRRIAGGQTGRSVSMPLRIFRVYPDGREEPVRGVRFRNLTSRSLRDIVAAGDESFLFQYLESGAPFAHMDAGGYVAGISVVCPSFLFDDIELERIPGELPKPPLVPPPPLITSNSR